MTPKEQFLSLASSNDPLVKLLHFSWYDAKGGAGDYGLNVGEARTTFETLISTTYMFQPNPTFTLQCRPFEMTQAQFDFLQDHDLDTLAFLSELGELPAVVQELDLSTCPDATSALAKIR